MNTTDRIFISIFFALISLQIVASGSDTRNHVDLIQITLSQQDDAAFVEQSAYELLMIASELDCQHLGGVKSTSDEYTWECNLSE